MNELSNEHVRELYSDFARDHDELRADLLDRLKDPGTPSPLRSWRMARISASLAGMAAAIAFAVLLLMPQRITLADVEAAMDRQPWIHVKFSDGEESWTCQSQGKRFLKNANGRIQLFDDVNHLWMQYVPGDDHITESRPSQKQLEEFKRRKRTPGVPESRPEPAGHKMPYEREKETVGGRELLRFDTYYTDALDRRRLDHQIWVDPKTQLQVRSRRWGESRENGETEGRFVEGVYDFPETGPASIYELGVPDGLKIVSTGPQDTDLPLSNDMELILAETRKAQARFPDRFRLLAWPILDDESPYFGGISRIYWNGNPKRTEPKNMFTPGLVDWSGVKIRQERFTGVEGEPMVRRGKIVLPESMLSMPDTPAELDSWLHGHAQATLDVSDGTRQYLYYASRKLLQVFRINNGPALSSIQFPKNDWPREYQWPTLRFGEDGMLNVTGDYRILSDPPEGVPGTVAVRLNSQPGQQFDFYLDPAHDYICIKYIQWSDADRHVSKRWEHDLSDLQQFPSGQWYATRMTSTSYGNDAEGTSGVVYKQAIDIVLLDEDEFPSDTFNGDKLLEEAKEKSFTISVQ